MSYFTVKIDDARGVVADVRSVWSDLYGYESNVASALTTAGSATSEARIIAALSESNSSFVRPFVVTMVNAGKQALDGAENIITTFDNVSAQQMKEASSRMAAVQEAHETAVKIGNMPAYTDASVTTEQK